MDAYWRAANYLSVGQIYLYDNPLLKEPLKLSQREAAGGWPLGHHAGPELHLRAFEPGHSRSTTWTCSTRWSWPRRPGVGGQHVPRGLLQRDLSRHQSGRSRAQKAVHAILVSGRDFQPLWRRRRRGPSTRAASSGTRSAMPSGPLSTIRISSSPVSLATGKRKRDPWATAWHSTKFPESHY